MGEKSDQIERHIQQTRNELGENINERDDKVKHAVDWRAQCQERPMALMGAAFVGGMLLSALIPGRLRRSSSLSDPWKARSDDRWKSASDSSRYSNASSNTYQQKASETWENVKEALVGVAATKASDFLEQIIPGFAEHYKRRASRTSGSPSSGIPDSWQKTSGSGTDYGAHS